MSLLVLILLAYCVNMKDSDRRLASNRRPILKSMSDFYITDICISDLCSFFKFSNRRLILKSMTFFQIIKSASDSQIYGRFSLSQIEVQWHH